MENVSLALVPGLALAVVVAFVFLARAIWKRQLWAALAGLAVFAASAWLMIDELGTCHLPAMDPEIRGIADVAGFWVDHDEGLFLLPGGEYMCRHGGTCADLGTSGTWAWTDRQITFAPGAGGTVVKRLVIYQHKLVMTSSPDDRDLGAGHRSFMRIGR
jgi:hypothetical protein